MATLEHKPNGSVKITVSSGYDSTGKQIRHRMVIPANDLSSLTEKQKQKEIEKRKVLFEQQVKNGTYLDGEKITFKEFAEKWLVDYAEKQLAPKTLYEARRMLELRIYPGLGHLHLSKLQPHHLLSFYNNLSENGMRLDYKYKLTKSNHYILESDNIKECIDTRTISRLKAGKPTRKETAIRISNYFNVPIEKTFEPVEENKGLSTKTISNYHGLISSILACAIQWQIISTNPCERVKPPKKIKTEAAHYDDDQVATMLALLDNEPLKYKTIIYMAIYTGARLGELTALNWSDIDFDKHTVKISKSLQYLPQVGKYEKNPKTEKGNRVIGIPATVIELLKYHRKIQIEDKLRLGELWHDTDKIIVQWNGDYVQPTNITKWFKQFQVKNGLPPLTFHQLRHTNASLMINQGADVLTVSKRLGHAQTSTTMNIYSHALQKSDMEAVNGLEKLLNKNKGNSNSVMQS